MNRSWISTATVVVMGVTALIVASPFGGRVAADWGPAIDFALGVSLTTMAFLEVGRTGLVWLSRAASLGWIAGGLVVGIGLFVTGASSIVHARDASFDWLAIGGIVAALAGVQWQHRARRTHVA